MKIIIGFGIILYYTCWTALFIFNPQLFSEDTGYTNTIDLNETALDPTSELDKGGFFTQGVSFTRFFGIILFGIGLPSTVPTGLIIAVFLWQTVMTILSLLWIFSAIWDG